MKKSFITIILSFIFFNLFSQTDFKKEDLPQFFVQNGDTLGIILTIEQVQKLDNNSELLIAFEKLSLKCDSLDMYYVKVINDMNEKIALLQVKIGNINQQGNEKDDIIKNLKEQIMVRGEQFDLCEKQRFNDSIIIKDLKKDLRKSKFKNVIGWSTTGVLSTIVTTLVIVLGIIGVKK